MGSCLGASCTTGRAVSYGPRVRACARDGFCSPPPLWGSKRQPLFHGGAGRRHGAHGLLHARDDRLRPPQGHQGTEPPGADPGRRHVVRRRAPEDQPMPERRRRGLHREAPAEQGRAAPPELLRRREAQQGRRAVRGRRRGQEESKAAASCRRRVAVWTASEPRRSRHGAALVGRGVPAAPAQARRAGVRGAVPGRAPAQVGVVGRPLLALPVVRLSSGACPGHQQETGDANAEFFSC
ncbi:RR1-Corn type-A response regulator isoform X1 [Zea mays]|uniref:Two-component response regulator ARR16 n=1 Tax=Zea mays TaxID=4577 RepID=B4FNH0_MAIZE|nr:RR1-Corn type-A response regulator [Zea mays]XP_035818840.1 RR1-Corn type-A response regulator isoform X1 [Zea mays]ACF83663.1 unknown [Zea mays]AQK43821.1 Two-component response regulator ARR16 [Zea mays]|eukprot:NP_001140358.1 RR1-Corn type-A response regulator [Zea mays]